MFTGIIEATGLVQAINRSGNDALVIINSGKLDLSDVKIGDSIATNGVCLTVTALGAQSFTADVSGETLKRTVFNQVKPGTMVNLEKAMLPTTRFGGHIVSGHVDGVGQVSAIENLGKSVEYWITVPQDLARYIAEKGSITVDGISLTVNDVEGDKFKLTIVPHTSGETTIGSFKVGQAVNLEVDIIARYVERLVVGNSQNKQTQSGVTMDLLARSGFIG